MIKMSRRPHCCRSTQMSSFCITEKFHVDKFENKAGWPRWLRRHSDDESGIPKNFLGTVTGLKNFIACNLWFLIGV